MPVEDPAAALAERLRAVRGGLLLVVTGAGVSAPSGLATFRGSEPDAVWKTSDVENATEAFFRARPVDQWRWYLERFAGMDAVEPNPAHRALAALERWQAARGEYLLVTQNIDTLHERAGSERMIKVHGSSDRVRCSTDGCRLGAPAGSLPRSGVDLDRFRREPSAATLPRCPECGAPLRAHVLFFDEYYGGHADYRWTEVERAVERMAFALFVGTSFSVGVTDLVLRAALFSRVPAVAVDPAAATGADYPWLERYRASAEELLPAVVRELGIELGKAPEDGPAVTGGTP